MSRFSISWHRDRLLVVAMTVVTVMAALWLVTLFRPAPDSGSLDARVRAVGATVRCPVCQEPIALNDAAPTQAVQMRQFIRQELQRGKSEDQVRQELARPQPYGYGPSILLAPPQQGFDLLAWIVPFGAVAAGAVLVLLVARRWTGAGAERDTPAPAASANPALQRYEDELDRELAVRD